MSNQCQRRTPENGRLLLQKISLVPDSRISAENQPLESQVTISKPVEYRKENFGSTCQPHLSEKKDQTLTSHLSRCNSDLTFPEKKECLWKREAVREHRALNSKHGSIIEHQQSHEWTQALRSTSPKHTSPMPAEEATTILSKESSEKKSKAAKKKWHDSVLAIQAKKKNGTNQADAEKDESSMRHSKIHLFMQLTTESRVEKSLDCTFRAHSQVPNQKLRSLVLMGRINAFGLSLHKTEDEKWDIRLKTPKNSFLQNSFLQHPTFLDHSVWENMDFSVLKPSPLKTFLKQKIEDPLPDLIDLEGQRASNPLKKGLPHTPHESYLFVVLSWQRAVARCSSYKESYKEKGGTGGIWNMHQ